MLLVSCLFAASTGLVGTSADAAPAHPVRYVADVDNLIDMTPDGRWAIVQETGGGRTMRVDLNTGETRTVPVTTAPGYNPGKISDDGSTYWWFDRETAKRTVVGGATTTYANPFSGIVIGYDLWVFTGVTEVVGSTPILRASNGSLGNVDFAFDPASGGVTRIERTFVVPAEHDHLLGGAVQSTNAQWQTFWSSSPTVIHGLSGMTPRLFRRHVPSGITHLVGAFSGPESKAVWLTDDGLVLIHLYVATGPQLFSWSRPGHAVEQLTVGPNGEAPSGPMTPLSPVNSVHATPDGTRVAFTSLAGNLDGVRGGGTSRLYVATLPRAYPNDDAVIRPDQEMCVRSAGGMPGDFVAVNVTPVLAESAGFGSIHSSDDPAGPTSNVNFLPGTVDPNVAFAQVGTDGQVCFTNSGHGRVHVIIDELVVGSSAVFRPPTADGSDRLIDTRDSAAVPPSGTVCVAANGVPGEFTGVNVTPIEAVTSGFGIVHSPDEPAGATSNVNFGPGTVDPNVAFTKIGVNGQICFTNSRHGPVNVIIDQLVIAPASTFSLPTTNGAARVLDTRKADAPVLQNQRRCVDAVGADPGDWVVVNATPVLASGPGFGTLHSSDDPAGGTSNVNFGAATVDPNTAIVLVGADSRICFSNSKHSTVHLVLDQLVNADAEAFKRSTDSGAQRIADTRLGPF